MANRTLIVKGKITKMYLDERHGTGISLAVISYPDPCADALEANCASDKAGKVPPRKMIIPGPGFGIGQEVLIKVEVKEER